MDDGVVWYWSAVGVIGTLIFYGRFVVQWWATERAKASVVPPIFWYMSVAGGLLMLAYGVHIRSPLAVLGRNLNLFIFARNIAFIWRERGWLHGRRDTVYHVFAIAVSLVALGFAVWTWYAEYRVNQTLPARESTTNWAFLALGLIGQILFALRMVIQWWVSERAKLSVVPNLFWHISVVATLMMGISFVQRGEWIFVAGSLLSLLIYLRNLWFIYWEPHRIQDDAPRRM